MTKISSVNKFVRNSWVETRIVDTGVLSGIRLIQRDGKLIQTVGSGPLWVGVCFLIFAFFVPFVPELPLGLAVAAPIALLIGAGATFVGFYALKEHYPKFLVDELGILFDESNALSTKLLGRVEYFQIVSRSVGLSTEFQLNAIFNCKEKTLDRICLYASAARRPVLKAARTYQVFSGLDLFDESTNAASKVP